MEKLIKIFLIIIILSSCKTQKPKIVETSNLDSYVNKPYSYSALLSAPSISRITSFTTYPVSISLMGKDGNKVVLTKEYFDNLQFDIKYLKEYIFVLLSAIKTNEIDMYLLKQKIEIQNKLKTKVKKKY